MLLEASIADGSIKLPVLDKEKTCLPEKALGHVLRTMMENGCFIEFEAEDASTMLKKHDERRRKRIENIRILVEKHGARSPQANAAMTIALTDLHQMQVEREAAKTKVSLLSKSCSCIEELEMMLDLAV